MLTISLTQQPVQVEVPLTFPDPVNPESIHHHHHPLADQLAPHQTIQGNFHFKKVKS